MICIFGMPQPPIAITPLGASPKETLRGELELRKGTRRDRTPPSTPLVTPLAPLYA